MPLKHLTKGVARDLTGLYRPRGWKVRHPRSYAYGRNGLCSPARRTIFCPRIVDEYTLGVYLHEVYHAKHATDADGAIPSHVDEYRAEMYMCKELRHLGFAVKRSITHSAKRNVLGHIKTNRAAGQPIDAKIKRWALRKVKPE
jgi:hypothetical protein